MADSEHNSIEWEAIRKNWMFISAFVVGIGFAIEQWDRIQDHEKEIRHLKQIVSTSAVVSLEKWRTKVDLTLENYCK